MSYKEEILEAEKRLSDLKKRFSKIKKTISTLSVGDTIYEEGTHGGWEMEYYPQTILQIDNENAKILVHEKSINVKKWITSFHTLDEKKQKYVYHY